MLKVFSFHNVTKRSENMLLFTSLYSLQAITMSGMLCVNAPFLLFVVIPLLLKGTLINLSNACLVQFLMFKMVVIWYICIESGPWSVKLEVLVDIGNVEILKRGDCKTRGNMLILLMIYINTTRCSISQPRINIIKCNYPICVRCLLFTQGNLFNYYLFQRREIIMRVFLTDFPTAHIQLANLVVTVSNAGFPVTYDQLSSSFTICGQYRGQPPRAKWARVTCSPGPVRGRYAYVSLEDQTQHLMICEVRVFGGKLKIHEVGCQQDWQN